MNARELIEEIQTEKKASISKGVLREEKALKPIVDKDIPRSLPDGWEWCRLGDYAMKVTDYVASGSFASLKENVLITSDENYAIMIKTADFANGFSKNLTYTDEHGYKFLENSNLFGGELILSNIGSIGKVFIVPDLQKPMTLASNTVMVRMTHNEYNKYMYYMFMSPFGQKLLISISSGTSMLKFNKTQLKSTIIPIAPLEEQYRICDILDKIRLIIDKREQELDALDELIKARFVEMFGDLADTLKEFDVELSELCTKITDGEHGSVVRVLRGHPFLNAKHILKNGRIDWKTITFVSDEDHQRIYKRCNPEEGDILLTTTGTIGNVAIMPKSEEVSMDRGITLLKIDRQKVTSEFVAELLRQPVIQNEMGVNVHASAIGHLFMNKVKKLPSILPPLKKQLEFSDFVKQVDKSRVAVQKALDEAQLLFDSLMQQYFG